MAQFIPSYRSLLQHEGTYINDETDPGGETYKGIARNLNSKWEGWVVIDKLKRSPGFPGILENNVMLPGSVEHYYRTNFWDRIQGDNITCQDIATSIFDFAVSAGLSTSCSLAQLVVGAPADGVIGPETLKLLNTVNPEHFAASFTLAKVARYVHVVKQRPASQKYFFGWVKRALGDH